MNKPTIILIVGLGHSGSTILERALSAYTDSVGLGEVGLTFRDYKAHGFQAFRKPCTCEESIENCPVWSFISNYDNKDTSLFEFLNHTVKSTHCNVIIDSSKHITQYDKYKVLEKNGQVDLYTILLVRDYRAWCTTRKFKLIKNETGCIAYIMRSWKWMIGYIKMMMHLRSSSHNYLMISYDIFAKSPSIVLSKIRSYANLPAADVLVDSMIPVVNQHAMRGNGMRFNDNENRIIRYSDSWRSDWRTRYLKLFVAGPEMFRHYLMTKFKV